MIAYELREAYTGTVEQVLTVDADGNPTATQTAPVFSGGVLRAGDRDIDVRAELDAGDGRIVLNDADPAEQPAIVVLDAYPALKRVAAHEDDQPVNPLEALSGTELRAEARRLGVKIATGTQAPAVLAGLTEQRDRAANGDLLVVPSDERTVTITPDGILTVESTNPGEEA